MNKLSLSLVVVLLAHLLISVNAQAQAQGAYECKQLHNLSKQWQTSTNKSFIHKYTIILVELGQNVEQCKRHGVLSNPINFPSTYKSNTTNPKTVNSETNHPTQKEFLIDGLVINQSTLWSSICHTGTIDHYNLKGAISPDTSFAMKALLERHDRCKNSEGEVVMPPTVILQSGGGLLEDGYILGELLRAYNAEVVIKNEQLCASSCAVAFLGGVKRTIEPTGMILFHAPYTKKALSSGKVKVDCNSSEEDQSKLREYYRNMTNKSAGDRLYDRTMWYCSSDDGWVVKGTNAAELYGIATESAEP